MLIFGGVYMEHLGNDYWLSPATPITLLTSSGLACMPPQRLCRAVPSTSTTGVPGLGGGFKYVLFSSRSLWKWSNLTNIFRMGSNHLLVNCWFGARWFGFLESPKVKGIGIRIYFTTVVLLFFFRRGWCYPSPDVWRHDAPWIRVNPLKTLNVMLKVP